MREINQKLNVIKMKLQKAYGSKVIEKVAEEFFDFCHIREFCKGQILVNIGDESKYVYFIVEGTVRSYFTDVEGKDMTRYIIVPGEFCAEECMMGKQESNYSIEAIEDGCMLMIPAREFKQFILSDSTMKDLYIEQLEKSLLYKMNREQSFMVKNATQRYIDFKHEYGHLEDKISQKNIATYLAITPETLSRIRKNIIKKFLL